MKCLGARYPLFSPSLFPFLPFSLPLVLPFFSGIGKDYGRKERGEGEGREEVWEKRGAWRPPTAREGAGRGRTPREDTRRVEISKSLNDSTCIQAKSQTGAHYSGWKRNTERGGGRFGQMQTLRKPFFHKKQERAKYTKRRGERPRRESDREGRATAKGEATRNPPAKQL